MDKIGFLVWDIPGMRPGIDKDKVIFFLKESAKRIQDDINEKGGIAGKEIFIEFLDVPSIKEDYDDITTAYDHSKKVFKETLEKNEEILFLRCPTVFTGSYERKLNYLKEIHSNERLLFTENNIAGLQDSPVANNVITLSKVTSIKPEKPGSKIYLYKEFFRAKRVFHFANFAVDSPIYAAKDDFHKDDIFLTSIDRLKDIDQDILEKKIKIAIKDSTNKDLISVGVMPNKVKQVFFNALKNLNPDAFIFFTSTDGTTGFNFEDFTLDVVIREAANYDIYLKMEEFIEGSKAKYNVVEKQFFNSMFTQFEMPRLVKYISDKHNLSFSTKESFIKKVKESINKIDGKQDIYLGLSNTYAFKDDKNILKKDTLVQLLQSRENDDSPLKILSPEQLSIEENEVKKINVNYLYIDVIRVNNISIEDGIFSCEFYLDIISKHQDPIKIIRFNNLSSLNSKFEVKEIDKTPDKDTDLLSSRYYITGNFDFNAIASNYPFDNQFIYLSVTVLAQDKNGVLQPVPEEFIDKDFIIDGWEIRKTQSGILRLKNWISQSPKLERQAKISEEIRVGWEIKRSNSMTVLKIGIPLFFLFILVYYTLFLPLENLSTSIGYLTTAFLSSIALYFSTERPQPLSMTTVDLIFAFFYFVTGISIISVIFAEFFPYIYTLSLGAMRILVPVSLIAFIGFLITRIRSKKFKPNLLK
tara:strand:- start:1592 stop:3685 length:2094 start_codon:yes stop_codon:yes gene_type:complete